MARAYGVSYPVFTDAFWMFGGQLRSGNSAAVEDREVRGILVTIVLTMLFVMVT
jgi:hypothetical protein